MSVGAVVSAPAVVLSLVLGWNLTATALAITMPAVVYTMFGGVQAVTWTDVKIMVLIVIGLFAMIAAAVLGLPAGIGLDDGLGIAAATGRLRSFDFSWDLTNQYTFWSGTIAALFLFCSYFGTDQSQVQRYLTARSEEEAKRSLLMSAYWKIPLQVLVLLLGILVFVFYVFNTAAADLQRRAADAAERGACRGPVRHAGNGVRHRARRAARGRRGAGGCTRRRRPGTRWQRRRAAFVERNAAVEAVRGRATALVRETTGDRSFTDVNYIIPTFILTQLPIGLIGMLIVAILMAATDTIAGELNSLSTATVIDFYKRRFDPAASDAHYLRVSKAATGLWGLFACAVAVWAAELGSLIEVVNRFGSFFYGSILGVFILAVAFPRATGNGAFIGLIAGMASVAWVASTTNIAFLWHNVVGAVAVVVVGMLVSYTQPAPRSR